jgi:dihydrofolate synthase/folylpolyglutamate synthase
VAGTNGKGSVSHFLASILQEAGYKVGLYTSPHLVDFRERIRINGEMIPQEAVVAFVEQNRDMFDKLHLSFFEMTVGMAFDYFAKEKVDIAVIEVGMGGRLDSTNVITPLLSVITNIGLDHTQFLGDTLEKIAVEKAGIIKDGVPVVIGETQPETKPVFERIAAERHAPITFADQHYVVDDIGRYTEELTGEYQKKNIATVLEAVEVLRKTTDIDLQPAAIRSGLAKVVTNTHLHGRWEKIGETPLTICETAHNAPGIDSMLGKLATMHYGTLHVVYGCVNDKDYRKILRHLNTEFTRQGRPFLWYFSQPSVPRGLPVADLVAAAHEQGIEGKGYENVKEAIAAARAAANKDDFVLVTGSIFLVADALA